MSHGKIASYAAYLPRRRVQRAEIGATLGGQAGKGSRVVASFDEDSTTMGVEAARRALASGVVTNSIYFATTSPPYLGSTGVLCLVYLDCWARTRLTRVPITQRVNLNRLNVISSSNSLDT